MIKDILTAYPGIIRRNGTCIPCLENPVLIGYNRLRGNTRAVVVAEICTFKGRVFLILLPVYPSVARIKGNGKFIGPKSDQFDILCGNIIICVYPVLMLRISLKEPA